MAGVMYSRGRDIRGMTMGEKLGEVFNGLRKYAGEQKIDEKLF